MERIIGALFLTAGLLTALVLLVRTYNGLVVLRSFCAEGWSGVLAAVRRRRAAIVQALRAITPGSPEEVTLLERVKSACAGDASEWDVGELLRTEAELAENLPPFLALCERNPETSEKMERNEGRTSISSPSGAECGCGDGEELLQRDRPRLQHASRTVSVKPGRPGVSFQRGGISRIGSVELKLS